MEAYPDFVGVWDMSPDAHHPTHLEGWAWMLTPLLGRCFAITQGGARLTITEALAKWPGDELARGTLPVPGGVLALHALPGRGVLRLELEAEPRTDALWIDVDALVDALTTPTSAANEVLDAWKLHLTWPSEHLERIDRLEDEEYQVSAELLDGATIAELRRIAADLADAWEAFRAAIPEGADPLLAWAIRRLATDAAWNAAAMDRARREEGRL